MEILGKFYKKKFPKIFEVSRIDNLLFDPKTFKVLAVLDWELSTIGDPISDLAGFLSQYYVELPSSVKVSNIPETQGN